MALLHDRVGDGDGFESRRRSDDLMKPDAFVVRHLQLAGVDTVAEDDEVLRDSPVHLPVLAHSGNNG